MVPAQSFRSCVFTFLALLLHGSLVEAKGWAKNAGGKLIEDIVSKAFEAITQIPLKDAIFSIYIAFAVFTTLQLIYASGLFKKRSPQAEFAGRFPFAILITLFATTLLTSYALNAAFWRSMNTAYNPAVPYRAMFAMVEFLSCLADIFALGAVLLLLRCRRDIPIADQHDNMTVQRIRVNSVMKSLPFVYLGIMFVACIVRLVLLVTVTDESNITPTIVNAFVYMGHTYFACLILGTFHVVASAVLQWKQIKETPSSNQRLVLLDQKVVYRIAKSICPALALRVLYVLARYIVVYMAATFNYSVLPLIDILVMGSIYAFVIHVAAGLGKPEEKEGYKTEKKEKLDGPEEA